MAALSMALFGQEPSHSPLQTAISLESIHDSIERGQCGERQIRWLRIQWDGQGTEIGYRNADHGYLLGACLFAGGDVEAALSLWDDVYRLADLDESAFESVAQRLLEHAFHGPSVAFVESASRAYLELLSRGFDGTSFRRHIERDRLVVPEDLAHRLERWPGQDLQTDLVSWWRSQDPLPGSPLNERLVEHLSRCARAERSYGTDESPTGLDARGEIYVRLGEPFERSRITLDAIASQLLRPGVTVNLSDFPETEFWIFRGVDRAANYLFVRKDGRFQTAGITDLVPESLQYGLSSEGRGLQKAQMLIAVLQEVFRQLAPAHQDFAAMYAEIDNYAEDRQMRSMREQTRPPQLRIEHGGPLQGRMRPDEFALRQLVASRSEDDVRQAYRERVVPRQFTRVFDEVDELSVAVRLSRFLQEDGLTSVELYWTPQPDALRLTETRMAAFENQGYRTFDSFLVDYFANRFSENFTLHEVVQDRVLFMDIAVRDNTDIATQTITLTGDSLLYHVGVQWDQFLVLQGPDSLSAPLKGPPAKIGVFRADSIRPLISDPAVLEMSDLVPHLVADTGLALSSLGAEGSSAYPFQEITSATSLALLFEVYHLNFDRDDQTRYRVAYEISRKREGTGLLRRDQTERSSVATQYTGSSRKTREFILIDLDTWPYLGEMEITVRVTDEVTGQNVSRALPFVLLPSE
jgi:GWxTD domain-containing protein